MSDTHLLTGCLEYVDIVKCCFSKRLNKNPTSYKAFGGSNILGSRSGTVRRYGLVGGNVSLWRWAFKVSSYP
jgi:hypothetical protein